jgi:hypothetical protein
MKKFILISLLMFLNSFASAQMLHHHDHPAVHGMLMVGQSKIYLSHLPMFHPPHDYQVVVEAELSQPGLKAYLASHASSDESIYTLVPEPFVLPDMIQNPHPFSAQIFKGHFERGGVMIADNVTVNIKKVIYFKQFSPNDVKPKDPEFISFGEGPEQFLAHVITTKPDYDQILKANGESIYYETGDLSF